MLEQKEWEKANIPVGWHKHILNMKKNWNDLKIDFTPQGPMGFFVSVSSQFCSLHGSVTIFNLGPKMISTRKSVHFNARNTNCLLFPYNYFMQIDSRALLI